NDLLSGAKRYKKILKKTNNFQSLKEKIRKNPDTKKIIGASHIYLVGESLLSAHNVTNWNNFISILNLDTSVPSKLRSSFSQESIEILQNGTDINDEQKYILISDLNESIKQFNYKTTDSINMLTDLFSNNITAPKTWGDGLSKIMIDMLKNAKINKSWLGFHNISHGINQFDTIRFAKNNGFLVSPNYMPYNIYIQQKNKSNRSKLENNIYKTCRILKSLNQEDSNNQQYLNPNCIESYERNKILQIQKEIQTNSWYIVKDGKGQLHNDYNRKHPLSQKQYAKTISKKFNWLVKNFQIVVGSSSGNAIVAKNLSFAHVDLFPDSTIKDNDLVQESSKFFLGNLSPKYMPSIFFRQSILKEKYKDTYLNPIYRLPLYQALLHDSVVLAHHDKFDIFKFSNVKNIYILLDLLYNTPPLYYLNLSNIKDRLPKIKEIHNFFYTTHNHLATLSLVKFDYLSSDRFLQKTTFSDQSIIIANFSDNKRKYKKLNLPPYSVTAILKGKKTLQFQTKDIS
ncbi:MAG: hypothetical protein HRT87_11820, partial [Legionellales bacterium]|nr:hypothetical protein [Legionellales bacterium]